MKSLNILTLAVTTGLVCLLNAGCATSSSLATSTASYPSTQSENIEVMTSYPTNYVTLGLLEAPAPKGYLRKPQHAAEMAIAALKKEAANLGAHAIVLTNYTSQRVPDFSIGDDGDKLGLLFSTEHKQITAVAIRLK